MLVLTHKGRRNEEDFRKLLEGSGFEIIGIIRSAERELDLAQSIAFLFKTANELTGFHTVIIGWKKRWEIKQKYDKIISIIKTAKNSCPWLMVWVGS
jgi:hypothetical protein